MTEEHSDVVSLLWLGRFIIIQREVEHSQEHRYIIQHSSPCDSVQGCLINLLKISTDRLPVPNKFVRGRPRGASHFAV